MTPVKRTIYLILGFFFLLLALIGILIPVLPTTPLLLLSGAMFLRSSKKLYHWLTTHPVYGRYVDAYLRYKAVNPRSKITAMVLLWLSLGVSFYLVGYWWVRVLLVLVGIGVSYHVLRLPTLTPEMLAELEAERQTNRTYEESGVTEIP